MANIIHLNFLLGIRYNDVIRPLYLALSQMTPYINKFNEDKNKNKNGITMPLKVKILQ